MIRKVALIGCKQGHWIRTSGMLSLRLNAKVNADSMLKVERRNHLDEPIGEQILVGPGMHKIEEAVWSRVLVVDGPHADALCVFEAA